MSSLTTNTGRSAAKRQAVKRAGGGNGSAGLKTTRLDPTRTVMMRKALTAELRRRFARLKALVVKLVVDEDAFGADRVKKYDTLNVTTNAGRWYGQPDREKVRLFAEWLKRQMGQVVAGKSARDILHKYALEGMRKGAGRAFDDVSKRERALSGDDMEKLDFYDGSKEQFLKDSFRQPVSVQRVEALAGRSYDDLENVTTDMSARMGRTLLDGLVQGKGATELATDLADQVDIGRTRAEVIARTEIIRAHAEGQLQTMEEMGVEEVGVAVEWKTADDDKVCEQCASMEGVVLKISEAHGMIPRHPSCRCAFLPAGLGEDTADQIDTKRGINAALKGAGADENWGPDVAISRDRPEGIFNELTLAAFCATGEGGGVDPSCSPGKNDGEIKEPWHMTKEELLKAAEGGRLGPYEHHDIEDPDESSQRASEDKVNAVMRGTKPIAEVPDDYAQQLLQQDVPGLHVTKLEGSDLHAVYTDKAAFDRLNKLYKEPWSAKGSAEMGRALGYSEKDIAAFYAADNFELYHLAREEHGMTKNRWVTLESDQRVYIDDKSGDFMPGGPDSEPAQKGGDYWGNKAKQPYYRPGPNPTVDNVITRDGPKGKEVLLIRRADKEGVTERGKWALPGGFHDTDAPKGQPWKPGRETARDAALRELAEETGLSIKDMTDQLRHVGVYEGGGRDPRDNSVAWSKSTAFQLHLTGEQAQRKVRGTDDADRAKWVPVKDVHKMNLAFDHGKILHDASMTLEELYTNAFCPTGAGGGVDPSCSSSGKGTIAEQSILALHDKLVGKGSGKLVEAIKTNYGKLPQSVRTVVEAGVKTAFTGWIANQALAEQIAKEQGLNDHDAAKLRATLVAADVAAYKPAMVGLAFAGPVAAALGWVVPPVTGAYLLTSAATSPIKTLKAAYKLVKKFHDDHTDVLNTFCATGEGGGIDPTCSPGGASLVKVSGKEVSKDGVTIGKIVGGRYQSAVGPQTSFAVMLDNGRRIELPHHSYLKDVVRDMPEILKDINIPKSLIDEQKQVNQLRQDVAKYTKELDKLRNMDSISYKEGPVKYAQRVVHVESMLQMQSDGLKLAEDALKSSKDYFVAGI